MFTGIVTDVGLVQMVEQREHDIGLTIGTRLPFDGYSKGASVCCSGVCLTVTQADVGHFKVDVSNETLSKTTIRNWTEGSRINLEPSLRLGDELGGHLVFGHVDGLAEITSIRKEGESWRLRFKVDNTLAGQIAPKGSVALGGISLTVNEVEGNEFGVNIIPYTWNNTTLSRMNTGDKMNIEIDMLARYVARQIAWQKEQK